eukprot:gene5636-6055_t
MKTEEDQEKVLINSLSNPVACEKGFDYSFVGSVPMNQTLNCLSSPAQAQLIDYHSDIRFTGDIFDMFYIPPELQYPFQPPVHTLPTLTQPQPPVTPSVTPREKRNFSQLDSFAKPVVDEASESTAATKKARNKRTKEKDSDTASGESSSVIIANVLRNLPKVTVMKARKQIPKRNTNGTLVFPDFPEFQPNLTPKEILQRGSFGGTYFRPIYSSITGKSYDEMWREFPTDWFDGLNINEQVSSATYRDEVNLYKVFCGSELKLWEESGWITEIDPYGWFQWYCRFYLGRRCSDDHRQISRALGVMGVNGRWKKNLINKCLSSGKTTEEAVDDHTIAPKIRQLLQHWGYRLTAQDLIQSNPQKKK